MRYVLSPRALALICLLLSVPLAALKLPWLPATLVGLFDELRQLHVAGGTESYYADQHRNVVRTTIALILYAGGLASAAGYLWLLLGGTRRRTQVVVWICSAVTALGLPVFESSRIGPETDRMYVHIVRDIPCAVLVVSLGALVALFLRRPNH